MHNKYNSYYFSISFFHFHLSPPSPTCQQLSRLHISGVSRVAAAAIPLQRTEEGKKRIHAMRIELRRVRQNDVCLSRPAEREGKQKWEKVKGDPQCDRGNPPNDATGACQATEVDRQTEHMLCCFYSSSSSSLLLRLVMWVVWVINEFMFNLNLDQLAWATGSAIAPYVVYPYSC